MRTTRSAACGALLLLCACSNLPVVTGDSKGYFDTSKGMYGGNEFDARSTEGKITVAKETASPGNPPPSKDATPAPAAAPTPAAVAAAPVPAPAAAAPVTAARMPPAPIAIDGNAFAAVFGPSPAPVRPSPEQLMRLDSLALFAADAARVDLQRKILNCRRAGDDCRLSPQ